MKTERTLLKAQRNQIYRLLNLADLNPLDFRWASIPSDCDEWDVAQDLCHKRHNYYCQIDRNVSGQFRIKYYPGSDGRVNTKLSDSWDGAKQTSIKAWIEVLKSELYEPDLWEQAEGYAQAFDSQIPQDIPNDPFSYQEANGISEALSRLSAKVNETFDLDKDQLLFVESKLEYLEEAVKRQGRSDWIHTAIGVLVSITVGLTLSPDKASQLWNFFKSTIGPSIGNLLGIPLNQ